MEGAIAFPSGRSRAGAKVKRSSRRRNQPCARTRQAPEVLTVTEIMVLLRICRTKAYAQTRLFLNTDWGTTGTRVFVGMERFELSASCSQNGKSGVSVCVVLYRNVLERSGLAGVMGARTGTGRTHRHSPVLPGLIHP